MLKKRKGFTLFEAIVTIAILSVSSITILQIFYTASNLSNRANDIDIATSILAQTIEVSKGANSVDEMFNSNDGVLYYESNGEQEENADVVSTFYVYYDSNWNVLEKTTDEVPSETKFTAKYEVVKEETYYNESLIESFEIGGNGTSIVNEGILYRINANITTNQKQLFDGNVNRSSSPIIADLSGGTYIGNVGY